MENWIFHVDGNAFYAAIECQRNPELRPYPVAVTGDPEARRGIVLTANYIAKRRGVKTGEAIWEAQQKCPGLICVGAHYDQYIKYSDHMKKNILGEYTDLIESFGLDEAWVSVRVKDLPEAVKLADHLRERIKFELGITASIGVANNKPFAKLGSDYEKPDATTVFAPESYEKVVWKIPAYDLLYVGPATTKRLLKYNILTIGDLANTEPEWIQGVLGKNGLMLRTFARGEDRAPVMRQDAVSQVKSVGNSTTTPIDVETEEDVRCVFTLLAESVSARMREGGFRAKCISIAVRTAKDLMWYSSQRAIKFPTSSTAEIIQTAMALYKDRQYEFYRPFRSFGLQCSQLSSVFSPLQLDMFDREGELERIEALENSIQGLRSRFGHHIIRLGAATMNPQLAGINPRDDHRAPAAAYYTG